MDWASFSRSFWRKSTRRDWSSPADPSCRQNGRPGWTSSESLARSRFTCPPMSRTMKTSRIWSNESRSRFGEINGIIHAAGVIRDSFVRNKTPEEMSAVFAPKVYGTLHLDERPKTRRLDFFVTFSSLAAVDRQCRAMRLQLRQPLHGLVCGRARTPSSQRSAIRENVEHQLVVVGRRAE